MSKKSQELRIIVSAQCPQFDVSKFPKDAERNGRKGALYFRPNSIANITKDEWECVKKDRPDLLRFLTEQKLSGPSKEIMKRLEENRKKRFAATESGQKSKKTKSVPAPPKPTKKQEETDK